MIKKRKIPKFEFTIERLTYFMKFTIQHVVYVIKQSVSPKMFTNERLFTIQAFTIARVHCTWIRLLNFRAALSLPILASITLLMCLQESFWLYLATNGSISTFPRDIKKLCECVNKCWCKKKAKVFQLDLLVHMRKTKDYSVCSSLLTWVVNIQMSNL